MADDSVKIIDFGVAHAVHAHSRTTGYDKGTLLYMAPEQVQHKPVSVQSDIYSLGVTLYEALTRRQPFRGASEDAVIQAILSQIPPPASDLNPAVSHVISRVVHKAMAKQPWTRFDTAKEFGDTLQKAYRNEPIALFDPSRTQPRIQTATQGAREGRLPVCRRDRRRARGRGEHRSADHPVACRDRPGRPSEDHRPAARERTSPLRGRRGSARALRSFRKCSSSTRPTSPRSGSRARSTTAAASARSRKWIQLARQHVDNHSYGHAREALQNALVLRPKDSAGDTPAQGDRRRGAGVRARPAGEDRPVSGGGQCLEERRGQSGAQPDEARARSGSEGARRLVTRRRRVCIRASTTSSAPSTTRSAPAMRTRAARSPTAIWAGAADLPGVPHQVSGAWRCSRRSSSTSKSSSASSCRHSSRTSIAASRSRARSGRQGAHRAGRARRVPRRRALRATGPAPRGQARSRELHRRTGAGARGRRPDRRSAQRPRDPADDLCDLSRTQVRARAAAEAARAADTGYRQSQVGQADRRAARGQQPRAGVRAARHGGASSSLPTPSSRSCASSRRRDRIALAAPIN